MYTITDSIHLSFSCSAFCGNSIKRGQLHFEGNLLFTHCGEIDSPEHTITTDDFIGQSGI